MPSNDPPSSLESKQISLHIEEFMDLHWKSFELAHITTQTFGVDLLFDLSFSMIWFVIYVYITIASLANLQLGGMTSDEVLSEVARNLGLLLELCFVTLRIFYTCHRAQQMSSPVSGQLNIGVGLHPLSLPSSGPWCCFGHFQFFCICTLRRHSSTVVKCEP